jgi:signal peptidase II
MSADRALNNPLTTGSSSKTYVQRWRGYDFILALGVFLLDQLTKHFVAARITLNTGWVDVIPNFFAITHVQNRGAAFSLFSDGTSPWKLTMLICFSVIAMVGITWFLWKGRHTFPTTGIALALILGGAVGNLWDRLLHGRVTDFLHVYLGEYSWPDFNVADSAIVIGAFLLIAEVIFTRPDAKPDSAKLDSK